MTNKIFSSLCQLVENTGKYGFRYLICVILENTGLLDSKKSSHYKKEYYVKLSERDRERELEDWFKKSTGRDLNLDNPTTFDEKMQWLKLYDSTPQKTRLADKYLVRGWVEEKIGKEYLVPFLGVWERFDDIDFETLPQSFVLKANHGCEMNLIVPDKEGFNKKQAKKKMDVWMDTYFGIDSTQQWQYLNIPHKVIAEKYMSDFGSDDLIDYKVLCFDGKPRYIQVLEGRNSEGIMSFYDTEWNLIRGMGYYSGHFKKFRDNPISKPNQLEEMLNLSEKLSVGFAFVRVDWYLIGESKIYFGEMTFTPAKGDMNWLPEGTDELLGNLITLPSEKYIVK